MFVNFLLIGHQVHYSYAADRDYIQAEELAQRQAVRSEDLRRGGAADPEREAAALLYRFVNYEADNLVFADIYGGFLVASLVLAVLCGAFSLLRYLASRSSSPAERM